MALRNTRPLQRVSSGSAAAHAESAPSTIGLITLGVKSTGQRSAGNPPAPLDEAGTGNGAMETQVRHRQPKGTATDWPSCTPPRQSSTLPLPQKSLDRLFHRTHILQ
jgi:hypothetical protein